MKRAAYIEKSTYELLVRRLKLPQLSIVEEFVNEQSKTIYKVKTKFRTLNTTPSRYIYYTSDGNLYIGNRNKIKLTKVLSALWNIRNSLKLRDLKAKWMSYFISHIEVGKPTIIYNCPHCKSGTIRKSCMIGHGEHYKIFEENGLKVAYVIQNGEIAGRALVWESGDKMKVEVWDRKQQVWLSIKGFVDRIYYKDESILEAIKAWAIKQGFWTKAIQDSKALCDFIDEKGNYRDNEIVRVQFTNFRINANEEWFTNIKWPSMDTLKFLIIKKFDDGYGILLKNTPMGRCEENANIMLRLENAGGGISAIFYRCQNCTVWASKIHKVKRNGKLINVCDICKTDMNYHIRLAQSLKLSLPSLDV